MKHWKCFSWLFLLVLAASAVAQEQPPQEQPAQDQAVQEEQVPQPTQKPVIEPLRVWADASSYKYYQDSTKSYVEIYAAVMRSEFQFEDQGGIYRAGCLLYGEAIDSKTQKVVDSVSTVLPLTVKYLEDAYDESVRQFEIMPMLLPPGIYKMRITAVDMITKRTGVSTFGLEVRDFESNELQMSDIEFAYDIRPVQNESLSSSLIKAGRVVQPNPNRYISNEDSVLYVYCEVYNLKPPSGDSEKFELKSSLHGETGYTVREYPVQTLDKPGESAVITRGIPVYGVPGGEYELRLVVEDKATGKKATTSKTFMMIYSFDQLAPTMTSSGSFSEEDAELMQKVIRYITTKEEKETYESLDLDGKRAFLAQFWERRNPNPGSGVNIYKNAIFQRFAYANQNFSTTLIDKTDGWRTDRGRIYITYGTPDDVVRRPSQMGSKPLEIWYYYSLPNQRGNDYCIFVDEDGYGDYQLKSSSLIGEINNPEWDDALTEF